MIQSIEAKTILTKSKLPNVDYCCNLYIGCMHACKYCYADFMKRFTGHCEEWGSFVDYKDNAISLLHKEIKKIQEKQTVLLGSVTDSYQPIENKLLLTRKSLIEFSKYNIQLSILTKSDLITRDIDIIKNIKNCEVGISLSCIDNYIASELEPYSSSPLKRINALKELKNSGVKTYVFIGPIVPNLTNLEEIFMGISGYADYVMGESLNITNTNYGNLNKSFEKIAGYEISKSIICKVRDYEYWNNVKENFDELCNIYKIINKGFYTHVKKK